MVLVFGASAPATAAILMAFFIGAAVGSLLGGRLLRAFRNPLACYAIVELWIGIMSLTVPALVHHLPVLLKAFGDPAAMSFQPYLVRLILAMSIVLPATAGMGATIPIMNALVHRFLRNIGKSTALAYGVNTLGAVVGCLVGGFLLVQHWGVQNSLYFAALLNAVVVVSALIMWWKTAGQEHLEPELESEPPLASEPENSTAVASRLLPALYFVTGFLALGYEILWLRILSIYTATSTTTFALVLATYLFGFSLGSVLLFPVLARQLSATRIFRISSAVVGIIVFVSTWYIYQFPEIRQALSFPGGKKEALSWWRMTYVEMVMVAILVFTPTVFMGLAYPAICQALISKGRELGQKSGKYYFIGSLASAVGVGMTSLWIIPHLGLVGTLAFYCSMSLLVALIAHLRLEAQPVSRLGLAAYLLLLAGMVGYGFWGVPFVSDGRLQPDELTWSYRPSGPLWHHSRAIFHSKILSYEAGATATVIVKQERLREARSKEFRGLYIDDHHVASTRFHSVIDAKMLAHLPLMLHPNPSRALTVGFGSGGTSWSMCLHDISTTAVEIEPAVIRTAPYFSSQNGDVLDNPHFSLVLNDARNHLLMTDVQYDVIATDVTNLQYRQNSSLYTVEYFELMKARLSVEGVACAWIPMMSVSDESFAILLRSFQEVFPHASFWYMDYSHTRFALLIGTPGPIRFDMNRLREMAANPAIQDDLRAIEVNNPLHLPFCLYLDESDYREFVGPGLLHTDDFPHLEFSSAVSHYNFNIVDHFEKRLAAIRDLRPKNYSPYLINATPEELAEFERYELVHRRWADLMYTYLFDATARTVGNAFGDKLLEETQSILEILPDFMPARRFLQGIQ
jgi:spermidine synthase